MNQQTISPVRHTVTVPLPIDRAFSVFTESAGGTRVNLEHRNIERHGPEGEELRKVFEPPDGWPGILGGYREAAAAA